jgi:hypothetical protein
LGGGKLGWIVSKFFPAAGVIFRAWRYPFGAPVLSVCGSDMLLDSFLLEWGTSYVR